MGGNNLQRHLDGHPNLLVYPFESQLGTKYSSHCLNEYYHFRYSWPVIPSNASVEDSFHLFYDEEMKTYCNTKERSKFRDCGAEINAEVRLQVYKKLMDRVEINNRNCIEAYFKSLISAWRNIRLLERKDTFFVGYCPLIGVEADKIFKDFPDSHIIHVIRNPFSGYADTKKRPYPLSLEKYCQGYNILNVSAYTYSLKYPENFHIIRTEDFLTDKKKALEPILNNIGIDWEDTCLYPSFNSEKLNSLPPWGQFNSFSSEQNEKARKQLTEDEIDRIHIEVPLVLDTFYTDYISIYENWL